MSPILGYMGAHGPVVGGSAGRVLPGAGIRRSVGADAAGAVWRRRGRMPAEECNQAGNMMQAAAMGGYGALPGMMGSTVRRWATTACCRTLQTWPTTPTSRDILPPNQTDGAGILAEHDAVGSIRAHRGVNRLGSSRHGMMQGKAIGDTMAGLANTNASTMLNAYGQGLGAQQGALGQTGQMLGNLQAPTNWRGNSARCTARAHRCRARVRMHCAGRVDARAGRADGRRLPAEGAGRRQGALPFQYQEPWSGCKTSTVDERLLALWRAVRYRPEPADWAGSNGDQSLQTAVPWSVRGLMGPG